MKFCNNCNNILVKSTSNGILKFTCQTCLFEKKAGLEDTLMANVSFKNNTDLYKSEIYLNLAHNDKISTLVFKNCTKCDETIIKQISIGDNGTAIYVCPKCNNKFID